ncbi:hypothetical protein LG201_08880 [Methylobacillus gramineus]|uniref:hypothetical protein n=1 Tax=Methylobacillus gramineus TaxID=755169 RepID=UPI001CFF5B4F|nr:hypothetical protein [Methylobacillus gramineus]MCB5185317.1 hypothetical protein [Methylobacillus gramineus]
MKTKVAILSSLIIGIASVGSALADSANVDQSKNVFIERTVLGHWEPEATAKSNDKPDVDKSLDLFYDAVLDRNARVTPATRDDVTKTPPASDILTSQFEAKYRKN